MSLLKDNSPEITAQEGKSGEDVAKSFQYMAIYFRTAININALPFTYDKEHHRLNLNRKSVKYVTWFLLQIVIMCIETTQVTQELIRGLSDDQMSRGNWCLILFIFLSWIFVLSLSISVHFKGDEMITYMNQALGTRAYFKESVLPPSRDHRVVRAHLIVSASQSFFQGLMVAVEGTKTHYLYSNVPEAYRNGATLGIWGLYAYYRVISNFTSGYFHVFTAVFHVQTCKQILQYRDEHLESLGMSLKSYRMLQILNRLFNESFSKVFIPVSMVFLAINVILGNFGTLRFFGEMEFNLYMNFPLFSLMMLIFVFTFYQNNAKIYDESLSAPTKLMMSCVRPSPTSDERGLRSRNGQIQGTGEEINVISSARVHRNIPGVNVEVTKAWTLKEIHCIVRSMPIIAVRIGSFSPIKRSTVVSFFDFLLGNTISALLTWN